MESCCSSGLCSGWQKCGGGLLSVLSCWVLRALLLLSLLLLLLLPRAAQLLPGAVRPLLPHLLLLLLQV